MEELSDPASTLVRMSELTEREREILVFERQWFQHAGAKEQMVRDQFDVTMTRFYQELNTVLDKPAAMAFDPLTVKRLLRLRAARKRSRSLAVRRI